MSAPLDAALAAISDELIALRHDIHRWPEPGFEEVRTQPPMRRVNFAEAVYRGAMPGE